MLAGLGPQELLVIFGILVLLFGAKKIPEIGRGVGQGLFELKKGIGEAFKDVDDEDH